MKILEIISYPVVAARGFVDAHPWLKKTLGIISYPAVTARRLIDAHPWTKKLLGILLFLMGVYALLLASNPGARSFRNHYNLGQEIGLFSILSLGVGLVIITGGIDLSIGSVVGLCSTLLAILLVEKEYTPLEALSVILLVGAGIGLIHGLLITKLGLQPFVVTLCGLFIYRGAARWIAGEQNKGLGTLFPDLKALFRGDPQDFPRFLLFFFVLAVIVTVFLHLSVYGRYLYALGSNEKAAHYSGVKTDRMKILAYVLCSTLAAWFSFLFLMQFNSTQPSDTGSFYELYAIAGAVLGGCSLRGGQGLVAGIFIGTCIIRILPNVVTMWGIPSTLEFMIIGGALLVGAIMDEAARSGWWRSFAQWIGRSLRVVQARVRPFLQWLGLLFNKIRRLFGGKDG